MMVKHYRKKSWVIALKLCFPARDLLLEAIILLTIICPDQLSKVDYLIIRYSEASVLVTMMDMFEKLVFVQLANTFISV